MAHFAKINSGNIVEYVTYLDNEILIDENGVEQESLGLEHILNTIQDADQYTWKQCSYTSSIRNKYPSLGDLYIPNLDVFIEPKIFESWTLDESKIEWVAPVARPELSDQQVKDGHIPLWKESTQEWVLMPPMPVLTDLERANNKMYEFDIDTQQWELVDNQ